MPEQIDELFGLHMDFIRPFSYSAQQKTKLCISIFCSEQISSLDSLIAAKCYQINTVILDCRLKLFMLHLAQRVLVFPISINISKFDRINVEVNHNHWNSILDIFDPIVIVSIFSQSSMDRS